MSAVLFNREYDVQPRKTLQTLKVAEIVAARMAFAKIRLRPKHAFDIINDEHMVSHPKTKRGLTAALCYNR